MMINISEITEQKITEKLGQLSVPSRLGVKTSLDPILKLLDRVNHPERAFPSLHVGGTSGKGTTSTFLANILFAAGYKVGLFTKPHLESVRERFIVNQTQITPEAIMALMERMPADLAQPPTWFELMVALAFQFFADQKVDWGVIEVGLGGTHDATNIIIPELSILTNVGLDHTDILGDTVEKIARDKVGIVKPGKPVVSGVTQPGVVQIVKEQCARLGAPLMLLGRDFYYSLINIDANGSAFDFCYHGEMFRGLSIRMLGEHQVTNAALAAAGAVTLREAGYNISREAIFEGLAATHAPGRMEIFPGFSNIILDGAHSPPKMEAFSSSLCALFLAREKLIGVLSFSQGHDVYNTLLPLAPLLSKAILTEFSAETDYGNKRAHDPVEVAQILSKINPNIQIVIEIDPIKAIELAREQAAVNDLICVTGSIFLVGQIRKYLTSAHGDDNVSNS